MSDENFLGTLAITGRVGTAEMSKLVQDYQELKALRAVSEAARRLRDSVDYPSLPNHKHHDDLSRTLRVLDKVRMK